MNLLEFMADNEQFGLAIQNALLGFLNKFTVNKLEALPIEVKRDPSGFQLSSLSFLRLNPKDHVAPFVIAYSQADFQKVLLDIISPAADNLLDPKVVGNDIAKALVPVIEAELLNRKIALNPKTAIPVNNKSLGQWATFQTHTAVKFSFKTGERLLTIEIPVFDDQEVSAKADEYFGFTPNSRILVVDDSGTTRKLLCHLLMSAGFYNLDECEDGVAAFNKMQVAHPRYSLLVSDWHMPKMTGLELLKKVRGGEKSTRDMPVLLVTGERNATEVASAIKERVSGYIVKPFEAETVYAAMKSASKIKINQAA